MQTLLKLLYAQFFVQVVIFVSTICSWYKQDQKDRRHREFLELLLTDADAIEEFREAYYRTGEVKLELRVGKEEGRAEGEEKQVAEGTKHRCERCGLVAPTRRRGFSSK
jgi:hypothetical protein